MKNFRYIDGVAILKLKREACVGCGMCVTVCPHRLFALRDTKAEILDSNACMECGACARNCPAGAIYVNPDNGCGCAAYIINSWITKVKGSSAQACGC